MAKPPHEVLGVPENATRAEIDEAYRTRLIYANPKSFAEGTPEREKARAHCEELMQAYYVLCSKPTPPNPERSFDRWEESAPATQLPSSLTDPSIDSGKRLRVLEYLFPLWLMLFALLRLAFYTLRIGAPFVFARGFNLRGLIYMAFIIVSIFLVYSGRGYKARGEKLKWCVTLLFYVAGVYLSVFLDYPFIFTIYLIGLSPIIAYPLGDRNDILFAEFMSNAICIPALIISIFL